MPSANVATKKRIRDYQLLGTLGHGGMGEVALAEHEGLQRRVAIKRFVHRSNDGDDEEMAKERFYREGRAMARLAHHNIVGVYDLFEWRKNVYMVLEYVDGFDLAAILADQACPVDVACLMALSVARALEAAHSVGIIHRDVKAANVMISRRGEIKLMDFGVARQDLLEPMTRTGLVVGTPRYVAPEVINGETADARSDIYGVGALLYLALSGQRLFDEAKQDNLFYLILAGKYRPIEKVARNVPRDVRRVVRKCLEREPKRRYRSAGHLAQALEAALQGRHTDDEARKRLKAFLKARGRLTDEEVQDSSDVSLIEDVGESEPLSRRWSWVAGALAATVALVVADVAWFGLLSRAFHVLAAGLGR